MTALSENVTRDAKEEGRFIRYPVTGSDTIYQGALVKLDSSGYAAPAGDVSGCVLAGVAQEHVDNESGSAGDKTVLVDRKGVWLCDIEDPGLIGQEAVGSVVFCTDDNTVADKGEVSNNLWAGVVVGIENAETQNTQVWVHIEPATMPADGDYGRTFTPGGSTTTTTSS